jgi:cell wall assembly regulator SMI1
VSELASLLRRLETWLAHHRKHFLEGLMPPASAPDLHALQQAIGVRVPGDLATLLTWHNGQSPDSEGRFEQDWLLMGSQSIADAKRELDAAPREATGWQSAWVPFLDNDAGDYVCLDTSQAGAPVREFWQDRKEHPVVAPSLAAWIQEMVVAVACGQYHEDLERGSFFKRA